MLVKHLITLLRKQNPNEHVYFDSAHEEDDFFFRIAGGERVEDLFVLYPQIMPFESGETFTLAE